jgi:cellulose synthase/poly-beta-1,6-N-acetylglucosamine synthase-like glycosyltransferase
MLRLILLLTAAFLGIYVNVWFFLMIQERKSKFFVKNIVKNFPKISVLIPAHNEEKSIKKTLKSILNLDYPKNKLEIFVIDNGSTDRTSAVVSRFKQVRLLKLDIANKAKALNEGLKHAKGDIIGLLDADTLVTRNCLKKTVGYFNDASVGAVTNFIKVDTKSGFLSKLQNIEYLFSELTKKIASFIDSMYVVPGTMSLVRKKLLVAVGGFSDDTITEDMDIALTIHKKGYKIINCMDAVVFTRIPRNLYQLTKQRIRWYRGFIESVVKHSDIIFNRKFFDLGFFILPLSFIAIAMGLYLSTVLLSDSIYGGYIFLKTIPYLSFADHISLISKSIGIQNIIQNILMDPYSVVALLIVFFTSFSIIKMTLKIVDEKKVLVPSKINTDLKTTAIIPIYMLAYYFLIMIFWVFAFSMEIIRWKKKW